jgi:hypothetical protein
MRRALALLAVAGAVAALFATAARTPQGTIRIRLVTSSAACYRVTWTKHSQRVATVKPCSAASENGHVEYVLPGPSR